MSNIIKIITTLLIVLIVSGCAGRPITIPSISKDDYQNLEDRGRPLEASASGFQLLLFIPIGVNDRVEEAYSQIKAQAGGDYIADVQIKEEWTWAFVGTNYKTTIKAMAYRKKDQEHTKSNNSSLEDKLLKIKELLDKGIINNDEYAKQRNKILSENEVSLKRL